MLSGFEYKADEKREREFRLREDEKSENMVESEVRRLNDAELDPIAAAFLASGSPDEACHQLDTMTSTVAGKVLEPREYPAVEAVVPVLLDYIRAGRTDALIGYALKFLATLTDSSVFYTQKLLNEKDVVCAICCLAKNTTEPQLHAFYLLERFILTGRIKEVRDYVMQFLSIEKIVENIELWKQNKDIVLSAVDLLLAYFAVECDESLALAGIEACGRLLSLDIGFPEFYENVYSLVSRITEKKEGLLRVIVERRVFPDLMPYRESMRPQTVSGWLSIMASAAYFKLINLSQIPLDALFALVHSRHYSVAYNALAVFANMFKIWEPEELIPVVQRPEFMEMLLFLFEQESSKTLNCAVAILASVITFSGIREMMSIARLPCMEYFLDVIIYGGVSEVRCFAIGAVGFLLDSLIRAGDREFLERLRASGLLEALEQMNEFYSREEAMGVAKLIETLKA